MLPLDQVQHRRTVPLANLQTASPLSRQPSISLQESILQFVYALLLLDILAIDSLAARSIRQLVSVCIYG